ncbi:MAG: hypothetical protein H7Z21_12115 [Hymenobacter sp.]|nr:hypothetical protein [Hymenobacter sp.]
MDKLIYPAHESLYFHNSLACVVEHPGLYVRVDWMPTPMFSGHLREVYEHILLLLKESGLTKVLSDHQLMPAIMPSDQEWLTSDWAPRAVREGGYRRCAIVDAHDIYTRLGNTRLVQQIRRRTLLTVAHFPDCRSAESWLATC